MRRIPNPHSPEEVRRAFQRIQFDTELLTDGALGEILVGAGSGVTPTWTTSLTTLTLLTVDNITVNGAAITSSTGAISFGDENISTTGTISGVNVTSGADPGHTHTGSSLSSIDISSDTNLAVTSPIVLTGDTLSLNQSAVDHGSIGGLGDDDHTQYHNDTRGDARYFTETEHINTSAGAADAGKPIKLDAAGHIDATMLNDGDVDHGSIGGLGDDDHSQYSLVSGTRAFTGTVGGVTPVANADLATKGYVDSAITDSNISTATCDSDLVPGHPVYVKGTGNIDLSFADDLAPSYVAGICNGTYSATDSADFITDGPVTVADWTDIVGSATLTPGAAYYLAIALNANPDYGNPGGTGDRTALITCSTSLSLLSGNGGTISTLVDGITSGYSAPTSNPYIRFLGEGVTNDYIRFDFGVGSSKLITEAIWYQGILYANGTWQWQGSDNATDWTSIGATFTLGSAATQTMTELSGNATGYRYYQMKGVSGTCYNNAIIEEIEFKIVDSVGSPYGRLSTTAPTDSGMHVVMVGKALTTTTLEVEIGQPILLR